MSYLYNTRYINMEPTLVSSDVIYSQIFEDKPYTVNLDYSHPLIGTYETIDNDPIMRQKMVDYFYDLARDQWLLDEINDLLNYFKYDNGVVTMIKNKSEYHKDNINKDTDEIAQKKVKFITKTLLDKYTMEDILAKFVKGTKSKWVQLPQNKKYVMRMTQEYMTKLINKKLKL